MIQQHAITIPPKRQWRSSKDTMVGYHVHVLFTDWSTTNQPYWTQEPADEIQAIYDEWTRDARVRSVVLRRRHRIVKKFDRTEERGLSPLGSNKPFSLMR